MDSVQSLKREISSLKKSIPATENPFIKSIIETPRETYLERQASWLAKQASKNPALAEELRELTGIEKARRPNLFTPGGYRKRELEMSASMARAARTVLPEREDAFRLAAGKALGPYYDPTATLSNAVRGVEVNMAGEGAWTMRDSLEEAIMESQRRSARMIAARGGPNGNPDTWQERATAIAQRMSKTASGYSRAELGKRVDRAVSKSIEAMMKDGMTREQALDAAWGEFSRVMDRESYWRMVSNQWLCSARSAGQVMAMQDAGITHFRVEIVDDERTSDICRALEGMIIPVDDAIENFDPTEGAGTMLKFPKKGYMELPSGRVVKTSSLRNVKLANEGVGFPPYHFGCRSQAVPILSESSSPWAGKSGSWYGWEAWLEKGDYPGHPFRGNQWTGGTKSGESAEAIRPMSRRQRAKELLEASVARHERDKPQASHSLGKYGGFIRQNGLTVPVDEFGKHGPTQTKARIELNDNSHWIEVHRTMGNEVAVEGADRRSSRAALRQLRTYLYAVEPSRVLIGSGSDIIAGSTSFVPLDTAIQYIQSQLDVINKADESPEVKKSIVRKMYDWCAELLKGDYSGHPFRGNQWTGGTTSAESRSGSKSDQSLSSNSVYQIEDKFVSEVSGLNDSISASDSQQQAAGLLAELGYKPFIMGPGRGIPTLKQLNDPKFVIIDTTESKMFSDKPVGRDTNALVSWAVRNRNGKVTNFPCKVLAVNPNRDQDRSVAVHEVAHILNGDVEYMKETGAENPHRRSWVNQYASLLTEQGYPGTRLRRMMKDADLEGLEKSGRSGWIMVFDLEEGTSAWVPEDWKPGDVMKGDIPPSETEDKILFKQLPFAPWSGAPLYRTAARIGNQAFHSTKEDMTHPEMIVALGEASMKMELGNITPVMVNSIWECGRFLEGHDYDSEAGFIAIDGSFCSRGEAFNVFGAGESVRLRETDHLFGNPENAMSGADSIFADPDKAKWLMKFVNATIVESIEKYNPNQPRDANGRWSRVGGQGRVIRTGTGWEMVPRKDWQPGDPPRKMSAVAVAIGDKLIIADPNVNAMHAQLMDSVSTDAETGKIPELTHEDIIEMWRATSSPKDAPDDVVSGFATDDGRFITRSNAILMTGNSGAGESLAAMKRGLLTRNMDAESRSLINLASYYQRGGKMMREDDLERIAGIEKSHSEEESALRKEYRCAGLDKESAEIMAAWNIMVDKCYNSNDEDVEKKNPATEG